MRPVVKSRFRIITRRRGYLFRPDYSNVSYLWASCIVGNGLLQQVSPLKRVDDDSEVFLCNLLSLARSARKRNHLSFNSRASPDDEESKKYEHRQMIALAALRMNSLIQRSGCHDGQLRRYTTLRVTIF